MKSTLTERIHDQLSELLEQDPSQAQLNQAMRLLAKWRAKLLENTLINQHGTKVLSGPFAGLDYAVSASEGGRVPRLIGCYERTLHPIFEQIIADAPPLIIDVGCAEGYYAIGLAMQLPRTIVWARDSNPAAQEKCAELAALNGVEGRVKIGGTLTAADFDICRAQHSVVICDIEGAELDLLDPVKAKGLKRADVLIEVHEKDASFSRIDEMEQRFAETHNVTRIHRHAGTDSLPDWMEGLSDLDRLLALWEWRSVPTPWLWAQAKQRL